MASKIPDHVPAERVWDHDFWAFLCELDDPFRAADRLYDGPEIIWATNAFHGKPGWIFTRHEVISEAFANYGRFSSQRGQALGTIMDSSWLSLPVEADPPLHRYYRQILQSFFTPSAIFKRSAEVEALSDQLISAFADRGRCEFISEYAAIMPNAMVVSIMGMPQGMLSQFLAWEHASVHGETNEECVAAGRAIIDYLKGFITEQKRKPTSEVMQGIVAGKVQNRPLDEAEILGICYLLFVAGLDTVFSTMGWIMRHLAAHPALQDRLRNNPEAIAPAVEEYTRAFGVSAPPRTVARDMVYRGIPMKKGEDVFLPTFLTGRDPLAWAEPQTIDIDRKPRHVTFGIGPHVCLGIHLAKRELQVLIKSFLSRTRNFRIPEGDSFHFHASGTIGASKLCLAWEPPLSATEKSSVETHSGWNSTK